MVSDGDDLVRGGASVERLGFGGAIFGDEAIDGSLQVNDRGEYPMFGPAPRLSRNARFYCVRRG
jgi:hypothetical protein